MKNLIGCFEIESNEIGDVVTRENIGRCIQSWNDKEERMKDAIRYLNEDNKSIEKIIVELNLYDLIDWFLTSMLRKMPVICDFCHEWHNAIDEKAVRKHNLYV